CRRRQRAVLRLVHLAGRHRPLSQRGGDADRDRRAGRRAAGPGGARPARWSHLDLARRPRRVGASMRPMKPLRSRLLVVTVAALAASGCEKASGPEVPAAPEPEAVVATVSIPSVATAATDLQNYANAIKPGAGLMMNEGMIASALARASGAGAIDGLDLSGPVHMIVLDNPTRVVLVGKAKDRAALDKGRGTAHLVVRDGWAVIGAKDAVELVAGWAVPGLVGARPASDI